MGRALAPPAVRLDAQVRRRVAERAQLPKREWEVIIHVLPKEGWGRSPTRPLEVLRLNSGASSRRSPVIKDRNTLSESSCRRPEAHDVTFKGLRELCDVMGAVRNFIRRSGIYVGNITFNIA